MVAVNPIPKSDALSKLWIGECTIYEYQQVTDSTTHQTTSKPVPVVENEPCRVSFSNIQVTDLTSGIANITQEIKLFIRPDIEIGAGSKIVITQHNRTNNFIRSGEPAVYTNHQEVPLEIDKDV